MKRIIISLISGITGLILGTICLVPLFNDMYTSLKGLEPGPDAEAELFDLLVFVQWPIYFVVSASAGFYVYKRYITKKSSGPKGPGH